MIETSRSTEETAAGPTPDRPPADDAPAAEPERRPPRDFTHERLQLIASTVIVGVLTVFGCYLLYALTQFHKSPGDFWQKLVTDQFPVLVALPLAGLGSLFLTLVLRISAGPMEFEAASVKFKGAAAPIVFWVLCFLCCVLAIKLLWQEA